MAIESVEDAQKHIEEVEKHLKELEKLSQNAGLHSHASIWYGIHSAFLFGNEDMDEIADLINGYLKRKLGFQPEPKVDQCLN